MPIYEYRCTDCGNQFEEIISNSVTQNPECPACASGKTEKLMSRIGGIGVGKSSSNDFACASGAPCPGATACGAGGCCPGMH